MKKMLRSKKGQGMSEYLIILALVAIATIGAVVFFADNVREQVSSIADEISGADSATTAVTTHKAQADAAYQMGNFESGANAS
jgi:pilus assembly protein Flp/PilA